MVEKIISEVCHYLDAYGWEYSKRDDTTVVTQFIAEECDTRFNLLVSASEHWIGLTILPFLLKFPDSKHEKLLNQICKVNLDLKLARLAQTNSGEMVLCIDLPVQFLSEEFFHLALDIITYYADSLYPVFLQLWADE